MIINIKKIFFITFASFLFIFTSSFAYTFNQNLILGSSGEDVRQLQIFLNNYSPETKIANIGVGSPGNETTYFGQLTKQALIKFQNLNANTVLVPVGLSNGTGYFGPSTRSFINSTKMSSSQIEINNTNSNTFQNLQSNDISLNTSYTDFLTTDKMFAKNKDEIYIASTAKISDLFFYINGEILDKKCEFDNMCKIKIISDKEGLIQITSNLNSLKPAEITIVNDSEKKPIIKISKINLNEINKISGKNFTNKIKVYTYFGVTETLTKNNSFELEFKLSDVQKQQITETIKGPFFIENDNGLISDIMLVNYEI
jgi:hypothetical protein